MESPPRHTTHKSSLRTESWGETATTGADGKPGTAIKAARRVDNADLGTDEHKDEEEGGTALVWNLTTSGSHDARSTASTSVKCCLGFPVTRSPSSSLEIPMPGILELAESARRQMPLIDTVDLSNGRICFGHTMDRAGNPDIALHYVPGVGYEFHAWDCNLSVPPAPPVGTVGRPPLPRSNACKGARNKLRSMCQNQIE